MKKTSLVMYVALAETKKKVDYSTVRHVLGLSSRRFIFIGNKLAFEFDMFIPSVKKNIRKFKYMAWLDEDQRPRRFSKIGNMPHEIRENDSIMIHGIISENA